jgi:hypothetical protein
MSKLNPAFMLAMWLASFGTHALIALLLSSGEMALAAEFAEIERNIDREPEYESSTPKYCLLAFGMEAERIAWFVLDGDQIFIDRNCNRDLTDDGMPLQIRLVNDQMDWKLIKEGPSP